MLQEGGVSPCWQQSGTIERVTFKEATHGSNLGQGLKAIVFPLGGTGVNREYETNVLRTLGGRWQSSE